MREDGLPATGRDKNHLGVRVNLPGDKKKKYADITLDNQMMVISGGMSATVNDPNKLPNFLKPICLGGPVDYLELFAINDQDITKDLIAESDPPGGSHYLVKPATIMHLEEYEGHIFSTRQYWHIVPPY